MSEENMLLTPHNIQGELIKNEIEQNNLRIQAIKEQKYNELLRENKQLRIQISAREEVANKLKSTLEEIREKITIKVTRYFYEKDYCIEDTDLDELLQIIDKEREEK